MNELRLVVYGQPRPAGSKTQGRTKDGRPFIRDSSGRSGAEWRRAVAQQAGALMAGQPLLEGPIVLHLTFVLPRPKGHFGVKGLRPSAPAYPTVKPDTTKLVRAVEDALTGQVWRDDAQVVEQWARKQYGDQARCEITITRRAKASGHSL